MLYRTPAPWVPRDRCARPTTEVITVPLPLAVTNALDVDEMLETIAHFTHAELPFVAQVAQLARDASSLDDRERALVSLYRLALEHEYPYVADLANDLLCWIERERRPAA